MHISALGMDEDECCSFSGRAESVSLLQGLGRSRAIHPSSQALLGLLHALCWVLLA